MLRYLGIATLLDPAVSATVAATDLFLREGNAVEDLACDAGRESCCNLRQKSVVLDLFRLWHPFLGLQDLLHALALAEGNVAIITRMVQEAKSKLSQKITTEGWSGGISSSWIAMGVDAPRNWCNGVARYTLLRWAVNQDDDVWLSMRGTRHQQRCGTCGLPGGTFPKGYYHPPSCEACIRAADINVWDGAPWCWPLCQAYVSPHPREAVSRWEQEWG